MTTLSFDMGYKNLAFALVDQDGKLLRWEVVNILEGKSTAKKPSIALVVKSLVDYLETQRASFLTVSRVLIEIQPVGFHRRSNTMMKVLSHVLQAYFCRESIAVSFVSPKRKLQGCRDTTGLKTKERYAIHKQYAIDACRARLADMDAKWSPFFESHAKKDDLADCLLQCFVAGG